jgi:hypothetical protein
MTEKTEEKTTTVKTPDPVISIGLDVGTMHLCAARSDTDEVNITRNVFMTLDSDDVQISELSDISYVESDDNELFIIGSDAFKYANIFGQEISRPMEKGLISPKEISAIDVLTLMIKDLIGDVKGKEAYCSYSVPAQAIDEERSITYHESVFGRILKSLGVNHSSVNEAMAIIYSECAKEKFSGIAISFGAGMANVAVSYKGIQALAFSTARSGDWIDSNVAKDLGMVANRVTSIKEKYMKLAGDVQIKNKKTKRVLEALYYYHRALIEYTVKEIIKEFDDKVDIEIDEAVPVVISGGTSIPDGFVGLFKDVISGYELPFEISEIRRAKDPLTAVANGLLIKTMSDVKGMR